MLFFRNRKEVRKEDFAQYLIPFALIHNNQNYVKAGTQSIQEINKRNGDFISRITDADFIFEQVRLAVGPQIDTYSGDDVSKF